MVSLLTSSEQLTSKKPIQLGNEDNGYCTVVFGLNDFDKGKTNRTLKVAVNDTELAVLKSFDNTHDDLQDIIKTHDDESMIAVKVNTKTTKIHGKYKLTDLTTDMQCCLIVKPHSWNMNGQHGISLKCVAIKVIEEEYEFME